MQKVQTIVEFPKVKNLGIPMVGLIDVSKCATSWGLSRVTFKVVLNSDGSIVPPISWQDFCLSLSDVCLAFCSNLLGIPRAYSSPSLAGKKYAGLEARVCMVPMWSHHSLGSSGLGVSLLTASVRPAKKKIHLPKLQLGFL